MTKHIRDGPGTQSKQLHEESHHPIIEIVKHTISPLSVALFIWFAGKQNLMPNYRAYYRAKEVIRAARHRATQTTNSDGSRLFDAKATATSQFRSYSTSARSPLLGVSVRTPFIAVQEFSPKPSFQQSRMFAGVPRQCVSVTPKIFQSSPKINFPSFRSGSPLLFSTNGVLLSSRFRLTSFAANVRALSVSATLCSSVPIEPATSIATQSPLDSLVQIAAATPAEPLPFHNVERLAGVYDPAVVQDVLDHAVEIWSVVKIEELILQLHAATGLPWWSTIACATLLLRCITVPFVTVFLKHQSKSKIAKARLIYLHERMDAVDSTEEEKLACANEVMTIYKEKKLKVVGDLIIPLGFPPLMLSFFGAVHNLSLQEGSMVHGGTLWFPDLMAADSTFFLPVLSCLTWLGVCEMGAGHLYATNGKLRLWTRMMSVAFIPITGGVPCGVLMFWITSNCWEMGRIAILNKDSVRRALGIPLRSEVPRPPVGIW